MLKQAGQPLKHLARSVSAAVATSTTIMYTHKRRPLLHSQFVDSPHLCECSIQQTDAVCAIQMSHLNTHTCGPATYPCTCTPLVGSTEHPNDGTPSSSSGDWPPYSVYDAHLTVIWMLLRSVQLGTVLLARSSALIVREQHAQVLHGVDVHSRHVCL